jgi:hypothetical protein
MGFGAKHGGIWRYRSKGGMVKPRPGQSCICEQYNRNLRQNAVLCRFFPYNSALSYPYTGAFAGHGFVVPWWWWWDGETPLRSLP